MEYIRGAVAACALWATKWASLLLARRLRFEPATMNGREGFDLQLCRLWGGHALLMVPHPVTAGMYVCEVEHVLDSHPRARNSPHCLFAPRRAVWVNAGAVSVRGVTATGRTSIYVRWGSSLLPAASRALTPAMHWVVRARAVGVPDADERPHHRNTTFMMLLNHLWNVQERPAGFVERWALRGPEGLDEMWEEVSNG